MVYYNRVGLEKWVKDERKEGNGLKGLSLTRYIPPRATPILNDSYFSSHPHSSTSIALAANPKIVMLLMGIFFLPPGYSLFHFMDSTDFSSQCSDMSLLYFWSKFERIKSLIRNVCWTGKILLNELQVLVSLPYLWLYINRF